LVIHDQASTSTTSYVLMCTSESKKNEVAVATWAKDYSLSKEKFDDTPPLLIQLPPPNSPPNVPLHLEQLGLITFLLPPPKGVVKNSAFNHHARAAQNYSIVDDLAQAPSEMSSLEVLQSCPAQWKALLKAIGGIDPTDTNIIIFDLKDHVPRLPPQLAFQIQVVVEKKNIYRTVINEGASTCVMSVTCWKSIGSPTLTKSHNIVKAFNGTNFKPYGFFPRCLLRWKVNRSMSRLRSSMHLLIIIFYLVIAGLIPCVQLCLPFSVCYVSHTKERSSLLTNWPSLMLILILAMSPLSQRHLLVTRMSAWVC
jgi:hypothetical protein